MKPDAIEWMLSPEQRKAVEPMLLRGMHYCPPWIASMAVRYDPEERNLLSTSVRPEYRYASLRVGNAWFSESKDERGVAVYHEVLHQYVEALAVVFNDLLEAATEEDSPLAKWASEQWRRAEEAMICDLSRAIAAREKEWAGA